MSLPALAEQASDTEALKQVFSNFESGWNTPGFPGLEPMMTPNVDFVVATGQWLSGRDTVISYHRDLLKTFYAGSHLTVSDVQVRFRDVGHAVAHMASAVDYSHEGMSVKRPSLATATLVHVDGAWMIDTFHNTITGGPGYMFTNLPSLPKSIFSARHAHEISGNEMNRMAGAGIHGAALRFWR
jgi:uncharacterized protein (TIGR02246 family)